MTPPRIDGLPEIPLVTGAAGAPHALILRDPAATQALVAASRRRFTGAGVRLADGMSRRWLARTANPYLEEIEAVAGALGHPGAYVLNISYEWACTTGVAASPATLSGSSGCRLLRVLDWPLDGLGRTVVIAERDGAAGRYLAVTWPGFVGLLTGLAPGRFAAAFNQAPLRNRYGLAAADWLADRAGVMRSRALPPAHLLRRVFDECRDYAAARTMLTETPMCLPAMFALAGPGPGEGCIIERTETQAAVHEAPEAMANHWIDGRFGRARPRGRESQARRALLQASLAATDGFDWLRPPILNPDTRLAVVADPLSGRMLVQGYESDGPATGVREIAA